MKKTCLICGATSDVSAATCPNDGEASWSVVAEVTIKPVAPAPAERSEEEAQPEPPPPAPSVTNRRSSRNRG